MHSNLPTRETLPDRSDNFSDLPVRHTYPHYPQKIVPSCPLIHIERPAYPQMWRELSSSDDRDVVETPKIDFATRRVRFRRVEWDPI